ncbi:unnamed protein product, partial [Hapterophycus canaliculatus]
QRGELQIQLSELRFIPPSPRKLERWRSLNELRRNTKPETIRENMPTAQKTAPSVVSTAPTSAFLRVRVLPSGPWGFSRTFPLQIPRPVDWVRDPSSAGMILLPDETRLALEVDTSVHTVARKCLSTPPSSLPSPTAAGIATRSQGKADVEALMLEVCLFDNGGLPPSLYRSSSAVPPASCLIACGTMVLHPALVLGGRGSCAPRRRQEQRTHSSTREQKEDMPVDRMNRGARSPISSDMVLFGPASGERAASLTVETGFWPYQTSDGHVYPSSSPVTISDLSARVWAMKNVFYGLDPEKTGFVWLEDYLGNDNVEKTARLGAATKEKTRGNKARKTMPNRFGEPGEWMGGSRGTGSVGSGAHSPLGIDGDTEGGDIGSDLVHFVRRLLVSRVTVSDHRLVSWEVWGALSEMMFYHGNRPCQSGHRRTVPAVTAASVWRRAEELRWSDRKTFGNSSGAVIR